MVLYNIKFVQKLSVCKEGKVSTTLSLRRISTISCLIVALVISGCSSTPQTSPPATPVPTTQIEPAPAVSTLTPEAAPDPVSPWTEYEYEAFHFNFSYPTDWFGPDVYEADGSLRIAIGSDVVYPYGTNREDQISTIPDAYYITIQYNQNQSNLTWDDLVNSGWITTYLELQDLEPGATSSTIRSLAIKVRDINLGDFKGVEYIFTLPDTAQTERVYGREIVAFDENLNMLRIMGSPNLVTINNESNWKTDYQRVDESYQEIFRFIADSIIVN